MTITREQAQKIIDAADEVITALAGTNEDVHPDNSTKMVQLYDDLNDYYAPPEVVRELARIALASLQPININDDMAFAFCRAITDDAVGADEIWPIKLGLRAAFANVTAPPAPVSVPDDDHSGEPTEKANFKPVADLYGITSPTGSETTFTFDAVEARDFIAGGYSVQEYVELGRYQEAIVGNSPAKPFGVQ